MASTAECKAHGHDLLNSLTGLVARHSRGPWWVSDNGHELRPNAIHAGGEANTIVATTWAMMSDAEREANARLIAGTPDILMALASIVAILGESYACGFASSDGFNTWDDRISEAYERGIDALRQAISD